MNELTPQAKLEYITFLVRKYEASLSSAYDDLVQYEEHKFNITNTGMSDFETKQALMNLGEPPQPTAQPKAQVYLERIEAFLENK